MANSNLLIPFIRRWEGEFADDPLDAGGPTKWGVTIATYTAYRKRGGYPAPTVDDLKQMTEMQWNDIFKSMYWDRWRADEIESQPVANILVDWVWASGAYGITIPQGILGVARDGIVGPVTLAALDSRAPGELFTEIKRARIGFIEDIVRRKPAQRRFLKGWKNRIEAITFTP